MKQQLNSDNERFKKVIGTGKTSLHNNTIREKEQRCNHRLDDHNLIHSSETVTSLVSNGRMADLNLTWQNQFVNMAIEAKAHTRMGRSEPPHLPPKNNNIAITSRLLPS
jgi:hypothetical protein